jgi:hypothetical protein
MKQAHVTSAELGEALTWEFTTGHRRKEFVKVGCGSETGHLFCLTHGKLLYNESQKDSHTQSGKHRLIWLCLKHGAEKP